MSEAETKASRPTTVFLARWRGGINFLCDAIRELGWRQGGMRECAQCDLYMAGPQLGLTLERRADGKAVVKAVAPGSEGAELLEPGDVLTRANGAEEAVRTYEAAIAYLTAAPRPLALELARTSAREDHFVLGSVNFRLDEEFAKAEQILSRMTSGEVATSGLGPPPWVLAAAPQ